MICSIAVCSSTVTLAEEDVPDAEFLEYLGMWETSDTDWVMLDDSMAADGEKRDETEPEGDDSVERDDER